MLTYGSEFYLRKDFGFIDLGITAVLTPSVIAVYEVIRRHVWRAPSHDAEVNKLRQNGKLPAKVSQSTIATLTGMSRTSVCGKVAALKRAGWLQTETHPGKNGTEAVYVLGDKLQDSQGGGHEVFYADAICRDVWEAVEQEAKRRYDGADEGERDWVHTLLVDERVEIARKVLEVGTKNDCPQPQGTCSESEQGVLNTLTGGVQDLNSEVDKGSTEPEEENQAGAPPPPTTSTEPDSSAFSNIEENSASEAERSTEDRIALLAQLQRDNQRKANERKMQGSRRSEQSRENLKGGKHEVYKKDLRKLAGRWRDGMYELFPDVQVAKWGGKEMGQVGKLIELHGAEVVGISLDYVQREWGSIKQRFLKGKGSYPSVGLLLRFHDVLCLEAQKWQKIRADLEAGRKWLKDHPDELYMPDELDRRFTKAEEEYKALTGG